MVPIELSRVESDVMERWAVPVKAGLGLGVSIWLGLPVLVQALAVVMVMDIVSGTIVSIRERKLSSRTAFDGLSRKAMVVLIVGMCWVLQHFLSSIVTVPLADLVAGFYLWHETISILENADKVGLPVPDNIRQVLSVLQAGDPMKRVNLSTTGKVDHD